MMTGMHPCIMLSVTRRPHPPPTPPAPRQNFASAISLWYMGVGWSNRWYPYRQGLTLVHFSAQPDPFLTQNTPEHPLILLYTP